MLLRHALGALLVSFALSVSFWLIWGTFVMPGFIVMSLLAAAGGVLSGWLAGKRLVITLVATALIRIAIYIIATSA